MCGRKKRDPRIDEEQEKARQAAEAAKQQALAEQEAQRQKQLEAEKEAAATAAATAEAEAQFSGVSLDTEAANLIEQQQAYQASARILQTAKEMFQSLIEVV